jgi:hypothetical protein
MAKKRPKIVEKAAPWSPTDFAPVGAQPRKIAINVSGTVRGEPNYDRPCMPPKKGAQKGITRGCHVEFASLGDKLAKKYGVRPGIFLRACERPHERGKLIRVRDHAEAARLARDICACKTGGEGGTKACADKAAAAGGKKPMRRQR